MRQDPDPEQEEEGERKRKKRLETLWEKTKRRAGAPRLLSDPRPGRGLHTGSREQDTLKPSPPLNPGARRFPVEAWHHGRGEGPGRHQRQRRGHRRKRLRSNGRCSASRTPTVTSSGPSPRAGAAVARTAPSPSQSPRLRQQPRWGRREGLRCPCRLGRTAAAAPAQGRPPPSRPLTPPPPLRPGAEGPPGAGRHWRWHRGPSLLSPCQDSGVAELPLPPRGLRPDSHLSGPGRGRLAVFSPRPRSPQRPGTRAAVTWPPDAARGRGRAGRKQRRAPGSSRQPRPSQFPTPRPGARRAALACSCLWGSTFWLRGFLSLLYVLLCNFCNLWLGAEDSERTPVPQRFGAEEVRRM